MTDPIDPHCLGCGGPIDAIPGYESRTLYCSRRCEDRTYRKRRRDELDRLRTEAERLHGKADWVYDHDLDMHIPSCSIQKDQWRCGNGPLTGDAVVAGDCGEHGEDVSQGRESDATNGVVT